MRVAVTCGRSHNPSVGLRQGCPLSATLALFGIFIDDLHHHLQTTCPNAGVDIGSFRLSDLVYADDICLIASSRAHLQALIDAEYLGMQFGTPGTVSHLISPLRAKAAASWTAVQQRHSQLRCGDTVT